jgi:hypothetical protein
MRATVTSSTPLPVDVALFECTVFPVPVLDPGHLRHRLPVGDRGRRERRTAGDVVPLRQCADPPYEGSADGNADPDRRHAAGSPTAVQVTPTFTAALRGTATATVPFVRSNEDDGCQVGAPSGAGSFAALLGPALVSVLCGAPPNVAARSGGLQPPPLARSRLTLFAMPPASGLVVAG